MANIIFYVAEGMLTGKVAGRSIFISAKTGYGAVGPSDLPGAVAAEVALPIPVGKYLIHPPVRWQLGDAARLQPLRSATVHEDAKSPSAYRIHAQRLLGCDRSITPVHPNEFITLMAGLRVDGGGRLEVRERMEGNYPERWAAQMFAPEPIEAVTVEVATGEAATVEDAPSPNDAE